MNEVSLTMPLTRVLTDSLIHAYAKCKNLSLVFHPMTLYPKQKLFVFRNNLFSVLVQVKFILNELKLELFPNSRDFLEKSRP